MACYCRESQSDFSVEKIQRRAEKDKQWVTDLFVIPDASMLPSCTLSGERVALAPWLLLGDCGEVTSN
jgi:hypothetical protein